MTGNMPYKNFFRLNNVDNFDIFASDGHDNCGFILEVDLHIPHEIHDSLKDFPLVFTHEEIGKQRKLVGTLYDKHKYIIHINNLPYIVRKGIELTKIHRILSFRHKPYLK